MGRFLFVSLGLLVVAFSLTDAIYRCPRDWLFKNWACYKVFSEPRSWNDAELFCRKYKPGCHLTSIHSNEESADLAEYVSDYVKSEQDVWIGLNEPNKKDKWEWADRSRTNYAAWAEDEPNNADDSKFCVLLKYSARYLTWETAECEGLKPFLCRCA